jgi:hypothetical protein
MKFVRPGESILDVEVTNVSPHGFWLLIDAEERFLPFKTFPWFREASIVKESARKYRAGKTRRRA